MACQLRLVEPVTESNFQGHFRPLALATLSGFQGVPETLIGWLVERFVFDTFERLTVRRWGMQR